MFRISVAGGPSCRGRCEYELAEDILRVSLIEPKGLCVDENEKLRQKLAKSWDTEEARFEASESCGRSDAQPHCQPGKVTL
jgi:hypothetical protein